MGKQVPPLFLVCPGSSLSVFLESCSEPARVPFLLETGQKWKACACLQTCTCLFFLSQWPGLSKGGNSGEGVLLACCPSGHSHGAHLVYYSDRLALAAHPRIWSLWLAWLPFEKNVLSLLPWHQHTTHSRAALCGRFDALAIGPLRREVAPRGILSLSQLIQGS